MTTLALGQRTRLDVDVREFMNEQGASGDPDEWTMDEVRRASLALGIDGALLLR